MKVNTSNKPLKTIGSFFNKKHTLFRSIVATILGIAFIFFHNYIGKSFVLILGALLLLYAAYDIFMRLRPLFQNSKKSVKESNTETPSSDTEKPMETSAEDVVVAEAPVNDGSPKMPSFAEILKNISAIDYIYVLLGLVFMIFPGFMMGIFIVLLGIALIVMACLQFKFCLSYRDALEMVSPVLMWSCLVVPVIWVILAIVIIINPFQETSGEILFTGITMLLFGIVEIARIIGFKQLGADLDESDDDDDDDD